MVWGMGECVLYVCTAWGGVVSVCVVCVCVLREGKEGGDDKC